jgi:hypothetical protein
MPMRKPEDISTADKIRTAMGFTPMAQRESQEEVARYIQAQQGLPAAKAKFLSGDVEGAMKDLAAMGWSPHRVRGQRIEWAREQATGRQPSRQFQRFQQYRAAP